MGFDHPQDIARCYPHQLSGGMQQRAAIAAALSCQPSLLILDEPTTALDVTVEAQILALLAGVRRRHGMALFVISHNLRVIEALCDDVCVMYAGMIVERGPVARVFRDPGHPYTIGLLGSRPRISAPARARLPAIPGYGQGAAREETGCVFARRCTMREGACDGEQAPVRAVDPDHLVLCWKHPARPQADRPALPPSLRDAGRVHEQLVVAAGLSKSYGRSAAAAVNGVSFTIAEGEILGLVGESGCGKSTLGRLILGLAAANAGSVRFAGSDIGMLKGGALRGFRREAQLIFQNTSSALNPRHTIGRALARPLQLFEMVPPSLRSQRVRELLGMVQLPSDYAFRYPHELSGGERQRVAIARALATEPRFIVCDEPVSALDVSVQAAVVNLLADLRDEFGLSYLFISHDLAVVAQLSDRIAVMYRGRLCETGRPEDILAPPFHPYTRALLASAAHQSAAEAEQPGVTAGPEGCAFRMRCPHRMNVCDTVAPPLRAVAETHEIACHLESLPGAPAMPASTPADFAVTS